MEKEKINININDLKLLEETIKALNKTVISIKLCVDETGMKIHTRNHFARFHLSSNCITADKLVEICIKDLTILIKTLSLVNKQCKNIDDLKCYYEAPFFYFNSKDVKTKIGTVKEKVIQNSLDEATKTELTPVFEFKTDNKTIKDICTNKFIFNDIESARCYLTWGNNNEDMHKNVVYSELTNKLNELNSSLVLPIGNITLDKLDGIDPNIILDFDRLQAFNILNKNDEITIQLMNKRILVSEQVINNKDDTSFVKLTVYNSIRKN